MTARPLSIYPRFPSHSRCLPDGATEEPRCSSQSHSVVISPSTTPTAFPPVRPPLDPVCLEDAVPLPQACMFHLLDRLFARPSTCWRIATCR